ncbi:MAG: right-handed parallel beta-helix repeat-containing protein [Deltaproteobacteria bacterium]|nr:right-handed parallel beta-helix repeat-containing protein [Deltaproteobacteria bacterium]
MRFRALCLGLCTGLSWLVVSSSVSAAPPPQIRYLDVDSASFGSFVGIYGYGFGTEQGTVTIGTKAAVEYTTWTDSLIIVRVPAGATTGAVQVQVKGGQLLTTAPKDLKVHTGNIYVVSVDNGDDAFGGDEQNPFKTLYKALSVVVAGDSVLVRAGTYDEQDPNNIPSPAVFVRASVAGTQSKPITVRGWGGEIPVIKGSGDLSRDNPVVYLGGDYVRFARMKVDGTGNLSNTVSAQGGNIWLAGLEVLSFTEQGIVTGENASVVLEGNHVHSGGTVPGDSHGIVITGATSNVLDNEIDHLDNGYGLVLQYQTEASALVSANYIHDTAGGGIGLFRVKGGNRLVNNVLWNTGLSQGCKCAIEVAYGAQTAETATVADRIYYNTIAGPGSVAVSLSDRSGTLELHGNLIADFLGGIEVSDEASKSALKSSHNLWFRAGGEPQFRWGAGFVDFAAFKTASQQETVSIIADPLLVNQAKGDFHLSPASPAIDKGGGPDQPDKDYAGVARPQGLDKDWGAFEAPAGDAGTPDGDASDGAPGDAPAGDAKKDGSDAQGGDGAPTDDAGSEGGTGFAPAPEDSGGCGCSTPASSRTTPLALLIGLASLVASRRRRR